MWLWVGGELVWAGSSFSRDTTSIPSVSLFYCEKDLELLLKFGSSLGTEVVVVAAEQKLLLGVGKKVGPGGGCGCLPLTTIQPFSCCHPESMLELPHGSSPLPPLLYQAWEPEVLWMGH